MDTLPNEFVAPRELSVLERTVQWLVLTAQFLLKKQPDLRW